MGKLRNGTSIAAMMHVYHDDIWLPFAYSSTYETADAYYFIVNSVPWHGSATDNSSTLKVIEALPDPENKKKILKGYWPDEVAQRNFAIDSISQDLHSHVFIVDADEIYQSATLPQAFSYALDRPEVGCWHTKMVTYWKSARYRVDPIEPFDPPIFFEIGRGSFVEARNILADAHELIPPEHILCHHMSYARPNELIKRKLSHFSHALQLVPNWYEDKWLAWDSNHALEDLHPVMPEQFKRIVEVQPEILPKILVPIWERGGLP
ncbi:MAG: hypothetical protein KDD42_05290 [Bdellovibrionales bacterium]|nr:hypothetical protein [Bdellovibrionales bacterium]